MHKRLGSARVTGGASTLWESVYNGWMKNITLDLMGGMGWHGVAMVEFKLDINDGVPELMEVNGRFGQPPLSVAPGVGFHGVGFSGAGFPGAGFAYLPCTMATEGDVDPVFGDCARVGCGCVRAILRDILRHAAAMGDGGRGSGVIDGFLRSGGMGCDVLSKARSSARGQGGLWRGDGGGDEGEQGFHTG